MTETTFKIRSYGKQVQQPAMKPLRRPLSPFFHHHQPTKKAETT